MRQRRQLVGVVGTCLMAMTCMGVCLAGQSPIGQCRPVINPEEPVHQGGYLHTDGRVHFTVSYDANVGQPQRDAFRSAMMMWNDFSEVTLIVFEEIATGTPDLWVQRGAPSRKDELKSCSAYATGANLIWYATSGMDWAADDRPAAARIFAHEIGHMLNVDHRGDVRSVMREGNMATSCEDVGKVLLSDVQLSDAQTARRCAHAMHKPEYRQTPSAR